MNNIDLGGGENMTFSKYYEGEIFAVYMFCFCMILGFTLSYFLYPYCTNC